MTITLEKFDAPALNALADLGSRVASTDSTFMKHVVLRAEYGQQMITGLARTMLNFIASLFYFLGSFASPYCEEGKVVSWSHTLLSAQSSWIALSGAFISPNRAVLQTTELLLGVSKESNFTVLETNSMKTIYGEKGKGGGYPSFILARWSELHLAALSTNFIAQAQAEAKRAAASTTPATG